MGDYKPGHDPDLGYNRHASEHEPIRLKILSEIVRLIATPIGLVSEAIQHHHHRYKNRTIFKHQERTADSKHHNLD